MSQIMRLTRCASIIIYTLGLFVVVSQVTTASAATLYTDGNLSSNCTSGNYSITNRNCTGTDGNAYQNIDGGITNITSGDTLYIREGTYVENHQTIPDLGNYAAMTTVSGYPGEEVTWQNNTIYFPTLRLAQSANNVTIQNIHFKGLRYVASDTRDWELYDTNTWRTTVDTQPPAEVVEVKSGCNPSTFVCAKSVNIVNEEPNIQGVIDGTDGDWFQNYPTDNRLYIHSDTDPGTRDDIWETGLGNTIGNDSSQNGYIVVSNNTFDGNGHTHLKGGYQWNLTDSTFQNIGTDFNDHHIYAFGRLSANTQAVYERNYIINDAVMGAAFHIYNGGLPGLGPEYHVMRYNLVQGPGFWAFLLYGQELTVTNNSIYVQGGRQGFGFEPGHLNNTITNNIIVGPAQLAAFTFEGGAGNDQVITNNITFNISTSHGSCPLCTFTNNQFGVNPQLVDNTPESFDDFRLQPISPAIHAGFNLGPGFNIGLDNRDTTWPPATLDQELFGAWDIGAYIFFEDSEGPTITLDPLIPNPTTNTTPTFTGTATDALSPVVTVEYQIDGTGGSWSACTLIDGTGDESSEDFSCTTDPLTLAAHTIYVRGTDSEGVTTAAPDYGTQSFTVQTPPTPSPSSSLSGSSGSVPGPAPNTTGCSELPPVGQPNLFRIDASGTTATLYFSPVNGANKYNIYYGLVGQGDQFATSLNGTSNGVISTKINALSPFTSYHFRVATANGCMEGQSSGIVTIRSNSPSISQVTNTNQPIPGLRTRTTTNSLPSGSPTSQSSEPIIQPDQPSPPVVQQSPVQTTSGNITFIQKLVRLFQNIFSP